MAYAASFTVAEVLKLNDRNIQETNCTNVFNTAPLLAIMPAQAAVLGTTHSYLRETTAPSVGFRAIDAGVSNTKRGFEQVTATLKYLDASWEQDIAAMRGLINPQAEEDRLTSASLRAALYQFEKSIINGGDSGFDGFAQSLAYLGHPMVYNAGGTGSDLSSVYAIKLGVDDCEAVIGNSGSVTMGEIYTARASISDTTVLDVMRCPIGGYMGVKVGGSKSIGRLCNVETSGSSNILTDDLIAELLALFPVGHAPDVLVMNRTLLKQLQQSRTATNPTGAPAPFPSDSFGVKIICVESILNTETALAVTTTAG